MAPTPPTVITFLDRVISIWAKTTVVVLWWLMWMFISESKFLSNSVEFKIHAVWGKYWNG